MTNIVNAAAQYRRALEKKLRCSQDVKKRLLESFDSTLNSYCEDHPNTAKDDFLAAFGPPEEMATILMAEVTPQEQTQFKLTSLLRRILAVFLVVALLAFTIYIWFYKDTGLTSYNGAGIIDESANSSSNSDIGEISP